MKKILFVAGDPSGDAHAARVAQAIKRADPAARILAAGGPALERVSDVFLMDLASHSVVGFWEPLRRVPFYWHALNGVIKPVLAREQPAAVVAVDSFGFNRFTIQAARQAGAKVFYYISPQVWASRPGRIRTLKRLVDKMLVIFPFEEELYQRHGVPVAFVGHPLLEALPSVPLARPLSQAPVIGLLPGSRGGEVRRHLPLFIEAAEILSGRTPRARFQLFAVPGLSDDIYKNSGAGRTGCKMDIVRDADFSLRRNLDFALTCSGTATLENALLGVNMAVVYKMSWITYALARTMVTVKHISMPNVLLNEAVVPELIQWEATARRLADAASSFIDNPERCRATREKLMSLRQLLGGPGAAARAAEEILNGTTDAF